MKWYQITGPKLLIILGISLLWIILGHIVYALIGVKRGPKGGLDSLADALVYVFVWRILIYGLPILLSLAAASAWLWQNHRPAVVWVIAAIVLLILGMVIYNKCIRKHVLTPERVAARVEAYDEWVEKERERGLREDRTVHDQICDYVGEIVGDVLAEYRSIYDEDSPERKRSYIDAVMEAHYREIPKVIGWEYIPDVRSLLPKHDDGDNKFLLNNREMRTLAEHYEKTLQRDHRYDRYCFEDTVIAEWYSWLPVLAIFYEDGTMDLVHAAG